jgi:uncharacterized membrane protein YdfJ with MMPL/SSD domain
MIDFIKKYRLIIIIVVVVLLVIVAGFIINLSNRPTSDQGTSQISIDPDTGEAIDVSDRSPENNGGQIPSVVVLGLDSLTRVPDASINSQQIQAIRDDLTSKAIKSLPGSGDTLKIITPSFDSSSYNIVANLKYNDSNNYAKIYISLNSPNSVSYYIVLNNITVYKSGDLKVSY